MAMAESKVGKIITALGELEDDLDSLNSTVADMKRQMSIRVQNETDALYQKAREIATAEAEEIISAAREKATAEASRISDEASSKLEKIRADIDAGFDEAVGIVVSTIMTPEGRTRKPAKRSRKAKTASA